MDNNALINTKLTRLGKNILLWSLGLSLALYIPFLPVGLIAQKGIVLTFGAFIALMIYFLDSIKSGRFILPKNNAWKILLLLTVSVFVLALFMQNKANSIIGTGFDFGTAFYFLNILIYFFLITAWFNKYNLLQKIVKTVLYSGIVVVTFQVLQLVFGLTNRFPKLFIGIKNANLIGSFNDLGLFLSFFVFVLLITFKYHSYKKWVKLLMFVLFGISLVFLLIINYKFAWILLGLSAITLLVKSIINKNLESTSNSENESSISTVLASIVVVLSVVCIFFSVGISNFTANPPLNFSNSEKRPSVMASTTVLVKSFEHNFIASTGPNRYNIAWEREKSNISNGGLIASPYWSVSFNNAISIFFTTITTTGIFGLLLLVLFIILVFKRFYSIIFKKHAPNLNERDSIILSFLVFFSILVFILDFPNAALSVVIFVIWAIIFALSSKDENAVISFGKNAKKAIIFVVLSFILIVGTLYSMYYSINAYRAGYLVNRASLTPATYEGVAKSESYLVKAFNITGNDIYARGVSNIHLLRISLLVNDKTLTQDKLISSVKNEAESAAQTARVAVSVDKYNYQNYLAFLKVQESLISLGANDIYLNAINTADQALEFSPNNIGIIMRKAKIAGYLKNYSDAYEFLNQVNKINPGYADAYIYKTSLKVSEGNFDQALNDINTAISTNPGSAQLFYQRGLINMGKKNYTEAVNDFESILNVYPNMLDVYASLALSYESLGKKDSVIDTLTRMKAYVTDKNSIDNLITKIQNGGTISEGNTANALPDQNIDTKKTNEAKEKENPKTNN